MYQDGFELVRPKETIDACLSFGMGMYALLRIFPGLVPSANAHFRMAKPRLIPSLDALDAKSAAQSAFVLPLSIHRQLFALVPKYHVRYRHSSLISSNCSIGGTS
jgi:hypothetical protein